MKMLRTLVLALGVPVSLLGAAHAASAAAQPTEPPSSKAGGLVPTDFVTLIDDTATITVGVPESWTDVDTSPSGDDPRITAAPDLSGFVTYPDVPGVAFRAAPFTADTATVVRNSGYVVCDNEELQPYDDGTFVGSHLIQRCGHLGTTEFHAIAASPANQAFTAVLVIQISGPDELPILEGILDTFNMAPGGGAPVPSVPVNVPTTVLQPVTAAAAADAFPPLSGEVPNDWTTLLDDTQTLQIAVPSTWTETNLAPWYNDDGIPQPAISATTDENLFFPPEGSAASFGTFSVPGVQYQAFPFTADTTAWLDSSTFHDVCTADPMQTYDDGVFVGHIQSFNVCGGMATRNVVVVANPADGAFTAIVLVQLTDQPDDEATLDGLLSSFNRVNPAGSAPTSSVDAGSTTMAAGSDPLAVLEQALHDQLALSLTDEQGACLAGNAGRLDAADIDAAVTDLYGMPAAVLVVLLNCGVDVFDIPGG
jgi:hypothetical protein